MPVVETHELVNLEDLEKMLWAEDYEPDTQVFGLRCYALFGPLVFVVCWWCLDVGGTFCPYQGLLNFHIFGWLKLAARSLSRWQCHGAGTFHWARCEGDVGPC